MRSATNFVTCLGRVPAPLMYMSHSVLRPFDANDLLLLTRPKRFTSVCWIVSTAIRHDVAIASAAEKSLQVLQASLVHFVEADLGPRQAVRQ